MTELALPSTKPQAPLLRPNQVEEQQEERDQLRGMLEQPAYIQNQITDRAGLIRRLKSVENSLLVGTPRAYETKEALDAAVKEELSIRETLTSTMLSKDEMMRNPDGAPDKLRRWEKVYKQRVLDWKNIRLRLRASNVDFGYDENIANLEVYRPGSRNGELSSASGAQIERKAEYFFGTDPAGVVVFKDHELPLIQEFNPELFAQLPFLTNVERQMIRNALDGKDTMEGIEVPSSEVPLPPAGVDPAPSRGGKKGSKEA